MYDFKKVDEMMITHGIPVHVSYPWQDVEINSETDKYELLGCMAIKSHTSNNKVSTVEMSRDNLLLLWRW